MFSDVRLARPNLVLDAVHDNRHMLGSEPNARESIPYIIPIPDEQIAAFTYTWVNGAGEAGAAVAIFGPGIGPDPIQMKLVDRPVPDSMDFGNWQIEGFEMKQDLAFRDASLRWTSDKATISFDFSAYHPPYAYGAHAQGCPDYTATDRIEQSGTVKGQIILPGRTIDFETTGHRDHSWGQRDWGAFQYYNWFVGQAEGVSVHFWKFLTFGRENLRGYVFKDGLMAEITDVRTDLTFGDDLYQRRLQATVTDEAGRVTEIVVDFYASTTLVPDPRIHLREAAGRATYDGKPGVGWLEVGWPAAYLDYAAQAR